MHTRYMKKMKKRIKWIGILLSYLLATASAVFLVGAGFWFYDEVYTQIPKITEEKITQRPETTKITDRNGVVLFKIFDQDREYMPAYQMSPHMLNAIVSIEDEKFRKHPGIDLQWILRAAKNNIFTDNTLQGASTIDQQLVRNLFLTTEKTMKRKLKEAILTFRFHSYLKDKYSTPNKPFSNNQVKLKILELYLNYIPFGNNTFGIQTAAKRYFNTNAKNLTVLQSSILASLPKGTSLYNPYTNKDILVGKITIKTDQNKTLESNTLEKIIKEKYLQHLQQKICNSKWKVSKNWQDNLEKILDTTTTTINHKGQKYTITYTYGRKDIVLSKMLELRKISQEEYKQAFAEGLAINFYEGKNYIKAPHFVFYIMDIINNQRWEEVVKKWWLVIKTSLDIRIQRKILEAIQNNYPTLQKYWANNSANITINAQNGDIISYIWSRNFRDTQIEGQNDMIQAKRQLGSILKPLFYAKAFDNLWIWPQTIIPDTPIQIWGIIPRNYDNRFYGNIPVKKALPYSRNIPAIKIFYDLGGEPFSKILFKNLGIHSANNEQTYWYNMVLGGVEMPIYELVSAYRHLSTTQPAVINPILEIRDKNNTIIYKKNLKQQQSVFSQESINNIFTILWDANNFEKWVKYWLKKYSITFAIKSWTSGMKLANWKDRSRDGVLLGYDNKYITAFWAGNTDGWPMAADAYGFFLNIEVLKTVQEILRG